MLTPEQAQRRQKALGGTDMAAICGKHPYRGPLDVYLDKTGKAPPVVENDGMIAGNIFESSILHLYAIQTNSSLTNCDTILHAQHTFLIGHPDAIDQNGGVIEAKNMGPQAAFSCGWPNKFNFPPHYVIQLIHYCNLMNAPYGKLVIFIGGSITEVFHYERDRPLEEALVKAGVSFWNNHVLAKLPPKSNDISALRILWPVSEEKTKEADQAVADMVTGLKTLKDEKKNIDSQIDELEGKIANYMEDSDTLLAPDGQKLVTWKSITSTVFDQKAFKESEIDMYNKFKTTRESRTFRICK